MALLSIAENSRGKQDRMHQVQREVWTGASQEEFLQGKRVETSLPCFVLFCFVLSFSLIMFQDHT